MSSVKKITAGYARLYIRYIPLFLVLVIQACGFQLRGALEISPEVSPLYLQQNSAFDLGREIKQLLVTNKVEMTDDFQVANSQLILLNEYKGNRVLSVGGDGRAREYLLTYSIEYLMQFKSGGSKLADDGQLKGEELSDQLMTSLESNSKSVTKKKPARSLTGDDQEKDRTESISVQRTLVYDQTAVLAVTNETEILYKEMRRDAARLILLKLQARSAEAGMKAEDDRKTESISEPTSGPTSGSITGAESDAETEPEVIRQ